MGSSGFIGLLLSPGLTARFCSLLISLFSIYYCLLLFYHLIRLSSLKRIFILPNLISREALNIFLIRSQWLQPISVPKYSQLSLYLLPSVREPRKSTLTLLSNISLTLEQPRNSTFMSINCASKEVFFGIESFKQNS